jgi:hypothetical protein
MGSLDRRLGRLETSLSQRLGTPAYYHGARERLEAKLQAISESQREHRERGGVEPVLEGQSLASLLALVRSFECGEVPPAVAQAVRTKAEGFCHGPGRVPHSVVAKMVRLCLESRGA